MKTNENIVKYCIRCGDPFTINDGEKLSNFRTRKCCKRSCSFVGSSIYPRTATQKEWGKGLLIEKLESDRTGRDY